jgi:muramoyltetrapeptide carboxypeptidase
MVVDRWPVLKKGDIIDVVAPSSSVPNFNEAFIQIKSFLNELGLIARIPRDLLISKNDRVNHGVLPFYANNDQSRFNHLKEALYAEDSKAIWCIRGGSGAINLLPMLAKLEPSKHVKPIIGFSDITILHLFFAQVWNWPTIHGKVLTQFLGENWHEPSVNEIKNILFNKECVIYKAITPLNEAAKKEQIIESSMIGGNLCLVETSLSTICHPNTKDKIIFFEDRAERGYALDRTLEHLRQANFFSGAKAIIFGDFIEGDEKDGSNYINDAIEYFVSKMNDIPILSFPGIGHGQINHPLPMSTICNLNLGLEISLECDFGSY